MTKFTYSCLYFVFVCIGAGIAINSLSINETFCVTGSDDGFLRLWPLDFANVYLEAEHEGPVTAVDFSADGLKILAGTASVSYSSVFYYYSV